MSFGSRCSFPRISPQLKSKRPTLSCFWIVRPTFSYLNSSKNQWDKASAAFSRCLGEYIINCQIRSNSRGSALGKTCLHSLLFTFGNLQSFKSYSGFISATCVLVGVPKTLITSMRWSILLSPTNNGPPFNISNSTHPNDQISIIVVQCCAPKISSGARQHLEQIYGRFGQFVKIFAEPKSQITNLPLQTNKL